MKIVQLISSVGMYGAENIVLTLSKELERLGCSVCLVVFDNCYNRHLELVSHAQKYRIETRTLPCNTQLDLRAVAALRNILSGSVDVLHSHGYKANVYAVLSSHRTKVKRVTTCHNWVATNYRARLYSVVDKLFLRRFDSIVCVSQRVQEKVERLCVPAKKTIVITNGIELTNSAGESAAEEFRREIGLKEGCRLIGTVGRLSVEKGQKYFLYAAKHVLARFPQACFLIVGDGPLREPLKRKSMQLGIDKNVIFTGRRKDVATILKSLDVLVLPSLDEGFPMVILESMVAGCPVVVTDAGAIPELVIPNHTGLVVRPADTESLEQAIMDLLLNPGKARRLSEAARRSVERFSANEMARQYVEVYHKLLNRRGSPQE